MKEQHEAETGVLALPEEPKTRRKRQPPYALIIENDEEHSMPYVMDVLMRVCGHSEEKAFQLMFEAHSTGRALVWSGTMELAELKRDQIRGYGPDPYATKPVHFPLGCYIEPMPGE